MTERDEGDHVKGRPSGSVDAHEDGATAPVTWPRDPRERAQPRSRLNQALSVARQHADPSDPWVASPSMDHEPVVDDPFDDLGEPELDDSARSFQHAFADILGTEADDIEPGADVASEDEASAEEQLPLEAEVEMAEEFVEAPAIAEVADVEGERPVVESPSRVVVDLRDTAEEAERQLAAASASAHYGLGRTWGRSWRDSAQGWVSTPSGEPMWRPVVATTGELANWDVDTYLGVVTAEVAVDVATDDYQQLGTTLARGREIGVEGLVEEAIERGAHAVVGVTMQYTPIGDRLLLTMTGTAVTLREKR